jgi:hypothetical protein
MAIDKDEQYKEDEDGDIDSTLKLVIPFTHKLKTVIIISKIGNTKLNQAQDEKKKSKYFFFFFLSERSKI